MQKEPSRGLTKEEQKAKIRERYRGSSDGPLEIIPAKKQQDFYDDIPRRVAIYVRVSTDNIQQTSSYELQKNHYEDLVQKHPNWTLVDIYADEGISGTSLKKRNEFNRMICDCEAGKIDMIITKSVSRFSRNTVDCISTVDKLKALRPPVGVFFETEHIFTLQDKAEMSLNMISSMAMEESHIKSSIMTASLEMRFSHGICLTPVLLGYDHDEEGNLIINEEEAKTVQLIFFYYLYGYTCQEIANTLMGLKRKTKKGNVTWSSSTVLQILRNERYCGEILTWKSWTPNYKDHKSIKNRFNDRPQHRWTGKQDPIISKTDFIAVQHLINNAKYGNKGILPSLQVIKEGALKGFVPVNTRWGGFKAEDYMNACLNAYDDEPKLELETEVVAQRGDMDLRGFEIARSQFFDSKNKISIRFSMEKVVFGMTCLRKLENAQYVELLVHPLHHLLAIRVSKKDVRHAVQWAKLNSNGDYVPKTLPGTAFLGTLFDLLGWNRDYKYRVCGIRRQKDGETVLMFDMDETEVFMPEGCVENVLDEESEQLLPSIRKSVIGYPTAWAYNFGSNYYAQAKELTTFMADGTWQLSEPSQPYAEPELNVTGPTALQGNIRRIIDDIRQEKI